MRTLILSKEGRGGRGGGRIVEEVQLVPFTIKSFKNTVHVFTVREITVGVIRIFISGLKA